MLDYAHHNSVLKAHACRTKKYRDMTWYEVVLKDPTYAKWCAENFEDMDEELREAILAQTTHGRR